VKISQKVLGGELLFLTRTVYQLAVYFLSLPESKLHIINHHFLSNTHLITFITTSNSSTNHWQPHSAASENHPKSPNMKNINTTDIHLLYNMHTITRLLTGLLTN